MEMIQGMNKETRINLEFELDKLYDTKDEFELYYDLDDADNLACYHDILRRMDSIYEILLKANRI
jgi:hypothetical protein